MSATTGIQWTGATWNPVVGCKRVSPGCAHCYAKDLHDRRHLAYLAGKDVPAQYAVSFETVQLMPERLTVPLSWRAPRRIFVNSVSDLFHEDIPDEYIDRVFAVMALAHRHTFQVLTKRPARMREYVARLARSIGPLEAAARSLGYTFRFEGFSLLPWPIGNVWLGVSVENQRWADERIPMLLDTPAAIRFLSCEPLLGPVGLRAMGALGVRRGVDWVIAGGESGMKARPTSIEWVRAIRDDCMATGVSFFWKQWGGRSATSGGRELDGRTWDEFPAPMVPA